MALAAAEAVGAVLVGVDLLPDGRGGWLVAEVNGAVEFTADYAPCGSDVFGEAASVLAVAAAGQLGRGAVAASPTGP